MCMLSDPPCTRLCLLLSYRNVDFNEHVVDVLTLVQYILDGTSESQSELLAKLVDFTLIRNHRLLFRRLVHAEQKWGSNPIRWIHSLWHKGFRTILPVDQKIAFTVLVLSEAGLPSTAKNEFHITSKNAPQWADFLLRCLKRLEAAVGFVPRNVEPQLGRPESFGCGESVEESFGRPTPPGPETIQYARTVVRVLHELARSKAIAHLVPADYAVAIDSMGQQRSRMSGKSDRPTVHHCLILSLRSMWRDGDDVHCAIIREGL